MKTAIPVLSSRVVLNVWSWDHSINVTREPVRNASPWTLTPNFWIRNSANGAHNLFYQVFQKILVLIKVWETLVYRWRMEMQDSCGPWAENQSCLLCLRKSPPHLGLDQWLSPIRWILSAWWKRRSGKKFTSPKAKVGSWEEKNYSNWEEVDCLSEPKVNTSTCPAIKCEWLKRLHYCVNLPFLSGQFDQDSERAWSFFGW